MKTQEFTLKRIIENLDNIPSQISKLRGDDVPKLTKEEKKKLLTLVNGYNKYGEALRKESEIVAAANDLAEIAKLAETYAVNESGDWFQSEIIKRDFKQFKNSADSFQKFAKECQQKMQQMNALYEDMGHVLQRYYEIADPVNESKKIDKILTGGVGACCERCGEEECRCCPS
jgi:hypothetical protein